MGAESGFVLAQRAASEGPRWTRAVNPDFGAHPKVWSEMRTKVR
jgi:hypothetical protein